MRYFSCRLFSFCWGWCACHGFCGWIRLGTHGPGFSVTNTAPLFSERTGHRKPIARVGRYRVFPLGAYA